MSRDLEQYANDRISETLSGEKDTADGLTSMIERLEHDFDFDSYAPYTADEDDILSDYENDYYQDAKDILGDTQYTADDWATAKRAYVGAVAYCAYSSIFESTKTELTEAIEEFADFARELMDKDADEPEISISMSCTHGWAPHDRETEDGTHVWEPAELEGCRAIARKVGELWLTCTWTPTSDKRCPHCEGPVSECGGKTYTKHYDCECGAHWDDTWCCACNDKCPQCGSEVEPTSSVCEDESESDNV